MTAITMLGPVGGLRRRRLPGVRRRRGVWMVGRIRRALGSRRPGGGDGRGLELRTAGSKGRRGGRSAGKGRSDAGMTTAEYAVGTLGACALAAGLYKVVTSAAVIGSLTDLLDRALHAT
ncbi:DUF4244 domain-containing protein [Kitasatospora hibisci]|uniref:DUF4244 domain-containing protein n=1 Tax=Kitasatospora hibisci TaxID=3369522 RepID=UPI00375409AC